MGLRIWPNSATIPKGQLVLQLQVVKVVEGEDGKQPTDRAYDWILAQPDPSRYGIVPRTHFALVIDQLTSCGARINCHTGAKHTMRIQKSITRYTKAITVRNIVPVGPQHTLSAAYGSNSRSGSGAPTPA